MINFGFTADAIAVNPSGVKMVLVNGVSIFLIW